MSIIIIIITILLTESSDSAVCWGPWLAVAPVDRVSTRDWKLATIFLDDEDLLLPGGELLWDKSSKSFVKSTSKTKTSRHGYVPPKVPNSANEDSNPIMLPVIEDFKLLKTVGKGAFGKVKIGMQSVISKRIHTHSPDWFTLFIIQFQYGLEYCVGISEGYLFALFKWTTLIWLK